MSMFIQDVLVFARKSRKMFCVVYPILSFLLSISYNLKGLVASSRKITACS